MNFCSGLQEILVGNFENQKSFVWWADARPVFVCDLEADVSGLFGKFSAYCANCGEKGLTEAGAGGMWRAGGGVFAVCGKKCHDEGGGARGQAKKEWEVCQGQ